LELWFGSRVIHLLPWQGVVEAKKKLRDVMKIADLETGKMKNLIPPLSDQEEEMFKNMMRRLHTIFRVRISWSSMLRTPLQLDVSK
jgi:hypothetical protein